MENNGGQIKGILAFITTDKDRYLGGDPLSLLAKDQEEVVEFSEAIAEAFLADILELKSGDYLIIKK
jgi:predicted house-cleaning noncanonical NTP pyrophosphatase (MazG superfamily)